MASTENGEAGWFPDPEDATGKWLRYWDGEDWIDVPPRLASNRERERYVWPAAPSPKTRDQEGEVGLAKLLLLGGHGFQLFAESRYDLHFGPDAVLIEGPGPEGVTTTTIRYSDLTNLSIEGPGTIREGGGFVGGGVGIEGFFIGAAAAGVLNSLTTRTRVETLIGLQAGAHELIFLCTAIEPSALSLRLLREARVALRLKPPSAAGTRPAVTRFASRDITSQMPPISATMPTPISSASVPPIEPSSSWVCCCCGGEGACVSKGCSPTWFCGGASWKGDCVGSGGCAASAAAGAAANTAITSSATMRAMYRR